MQPQYLSADKACASPLSCRSCVIKDAIILTHEASLGILKEMLAREEKFSAFLESQLEVSTIKNSLNFSLMDNTQQVNENEPQVESAPTMPNPEDMPAEEGTGEETPMPNEAAPAEESPAEQGA